MKIFSHYYSNLFIQSKKMNSDNQYNNFRCIFSNFGVKCELTNEIIHITINNFSATISNNLLVNKSIMKDTKILFSCLRDGLSLKEHSHVFMNLQSGKVIINVTTFSEDIIENFAFTAYNFDNLIEFETILLFFGENDDIASYCNDIVAIDVIGRGDSTFLVVNNDGHPRLVPHDVDICDKIKYMKGLCNVKFTDYLIGDLNFLSGNDKLINLTLSNIPRLTSINPLKCCQNLKEIIFDGCCNVTDLCKLNKCKNLKKLKVPWGSMIDDIFGKKHKFTIVINKYETDNICY